MEVKRENEEKPGRGLSISAMEPADEALSLSLSLVSLSLAVALQLFPLSDTPPPEQR